MQAEILQRRLGAMVGETFEVLCEGPARGGEDGSARQGEALLTGRTDGNLLVDFAGEADAAGQFVQVEITKAKKFMLVGRQIPGRVK